MNRGVSIVIDEKGRKTVVINDIRFKGNMNTLVGFMKSKKLRKKYT